MIESRAISTPPIDDNHAQFLISPPAPGEAPNLLIGANKSNRRGKQKYCKNCNASGISPKCKLAESKGMLQFMLATWMSTRSIRENNQGKYDRGSKELRGLCLVSRFHIPHWALGTHSAQTDASKDPQPHLVFSNQCDTCYMCKPKDQ